MAGMVGGAPNVAGMVGGAPNVIFQPKFRCVAHYNKMKKVYKKEEVS